MPGARRLLIALPWLAAGVFRSADGGATWSAANGGLGKADVQALLLDTAGSVHAAAASGDSTRAFPRPVNPESAKPEPVDPQ
jgi:hypothetical protein